MDFLIRFVQVHKEFRQAEIEALAAIAGVAVQVLSYSDDVRWDSTPDESTMLEPGMRLCSHNLSNNLLSPRFASFASLRQIILKLQLRLSFLVLSLPKGSMSCGGAELATMNYTKTVQLGASISGLSTGRQVSNSP
jgi:hypothetical protein